MASFLSQFNNVWLGLVACLITGLFSGVGASWIFIPKEIPQKVIDMMLGVTAGIMLAATSFSLILPAIQSSESPVQGALIAATGILIGGLFLSFMDQYAPHEKLLEKTGNQNILGKRQVWIFVIAVILHNFPEGLAVGMGFGNNDYSNGFTIALAIGLQNIPEAFAVAIALVKEKYSKTKAFLIALSTGLVEPVGGLAGIALVNYIRPLLPFGLSFAAGAMLYVICGQLIPECQQNGHKKRAIWGFLIGFVFMMLLDVSLS